MFMRNRIGKSVAVGRRARLRPGLECLEGRQLLAVLSLESATVRGDGRIVELTFSGPATDGTGIPESAPGAAEGLRLSTNLGTVFEPLGTVATMRGTDLVWTTSLLVSDPKQVIAFDTANVMIAAPDHLIRDDHGNWTAAIDAKANNLSLVDANGFSTTKFQRGTGGATLYVSNTYGNDTRTFAQAQNPATPYKTLTAALQALRSNNQDGKGAAVKLLRGDTFSGGVSLVGISGQDRQHPMIIEDYWYDYGGKTDPGTRPLITSDWSKGVYNGLTAMLTSAKSNAGVGLDYVVIRRLEFRAINRDTSTDQPSMGLSLVTGGRGWLLDDLVVNNFTTNLNIQGMITPYQDMTILRSNIFDAHKNTPATGSVFASQGMYSKGTSGLLLSQNLFDRNGRIGTDLSGRDAVSHNIYLQSGSGPATVWGNVIRAGGSHGIQMRSGGILAYNFLTRNAISADMMAVGGVMTHNVVENAEDISPTSPRGFGLILSTGWGPSLSSVVEQNIVEHTTSSTVAPLYYWQIGDTVIANGAFRNNTVVDAGGFKISFQNISSTPHKITVTDNAIDAGSRYAYQIGNDYPTQFDWLQSDSNAYYSTATKPFHVGGPPPDQTLPGWTALTGEDQHSTFSSIKTLAQPRIGDYAASIGLAGNETTYINALRSRKLGAWPTASDMQRLFAYYGSQYAIVNRSEMGDGPRDFVGATDYRPAAPVLQATQDTGASNTDGITRTNVGLKFDVRNTISGFPVELLRNGVVVASASGNSAKVITLIDPATLSNGVYTYTVRTTGQDNVKILSPSTLITIDRTPPAAPVAPTLVSVTGLVPLFSVTSSSSTDKVELLRRAGGTSNAYTVVASRTGSGMQMDATVPAAGDYEYVIRLTDLAGNVSSNSKSLRFII